MGLALLILGRRDILAQTLPSSGSTSACGSPLSSDSYSKFSIAEIVDYQQTNAAGAFLSGTRSFGFAATADLSTNSTASAATLTVPGQTLRPMTQTDAHRFTFTFVTNSFPALSAAFPAGAYIFGIANQTTSISLPLGSLLPNPPQLSNYDAAQSIDPAKDFPLSWDHFSGGETKDLITVSVVAPGGDKLFQSADFGCPGALDGTATSILIPAGTLGSNQTFRVGIGFVKVLVLDTNSFPGIALLGGAESATQVSIATGSGIVGPPTSTLVLTNANWLPGGSIRFNLTTTPGVIYTVESNQNVSNVAGWTPLLTTNATANLVTITNTPPPGTKAGFYRVSHN